MLSPAPTRKLLLIAFIAPAGAADSFRPTSEVLAALRMPMAWMNNGSSIALVPKAAYPRIMAATMVTV